MTAITTSHIALDHSGRAFVEGTQTRVIAIVMDKLNGLTPEQIHNSYSDLSLSQIYAALAFYYDHQAELDAQIAREMEEISTLRKESTLAGNQPTRRSLEERRNESEKHS